MPWWNDDDRGYFRPSRPREAKGGIKAKSKRGDFGENWWAKRWVQVLEAFNLGGRLERGRRYARGGQVLAIQVEKGLVKARVQGSRPKPYEVVLQARTLSDPDWDRIAETLGRRARFAAKMLAGEMPQDVETVFDDVGVSLFPSRLGDLTTKCSCPDMANPCKHIAAVYYLLGEEFDRDPFLIFTLRGRTRDELIARMGELNAPDPTAELVDLEPIAPLEPRPVEPLADDPARFWTPLRRPHDPSPDTAPPPVPAGLVRRLGGFPFWRGAEPFLDALAPVYVAASPRGLNVLAGPAETETVTPETPSPARRDAKPAAPKRLKLSRKR